MGRWPEKIEPKPTKFEITYKDDDGCISIWKYDLKKFTNGPIEVSIKYPPGYEKMLKTKLKERNLEKKTKKIAKNNFF
jgi:hypothetical protein